MRFRVDHRRGTTVSIEMTEDEFAETVEWLELVAPDDGCAREWRAQLDLLCPPSSLPEEGANR